MELLLGDQKEKARSCILIMFFLFRFVLTCAPRPLLLSLLSLRCPETLPISLLYQLIYPSTH